MDSIFQELMQHWEAIEAFFVFDSARLTEPDMIARLSIQVLLLCGSAFFSGSETALFSLSRLDLQKLRRLLGLWAFAYAAGTATVIPRPCTPCWISHGG